MAGLLEWSEKREMTCGDLLAKCLRHVGVEVAFGLHGGHLDAFLTGCEVAGIRLVDTRHETAAVQAAEGYARITSRLGVCFVTANSGFSNGIPGLATAFADRSPILCITSSVPLRDTGNNSLQGSLDQVVVSKPVTKFAHRFTNPEDCPRILAHAIRVALSGAPGPVLLEFPIDVLFSPIHEKLVSWGAISSPLPYPPGPNPAAVKECFQLLKGAKRPVIITGTGARTSQAKSELVTFASRHGIPVFNSQKHFSAFPDGFTLHAGAASYLAYLPIMGKDTPDLVMLLGARTGMYLGGRSGAMIPDSCKLIQVDVDGSEIGRTLAVDLGIVSDVGAFLGAINMSPESQSYGVVDKAWTAMLLSLNQLPRPFDSDPQVRESGRLHPYHALKQVLSAAEKGCIVVLDGGEAASWTHDLISLCKPDTVIFATGYLGFLGTGFGYALGCAIAAPDKKIIHIQGDGSAGFHFMELDTYRRFNLNIMTVVVNNACWGMSLNGQELLYSIKVPNRPVSSLSPSVDFETVASGLGNFAAKVTRVEDIAPTVVACQQQGSPSAINLIVDRRPIHPVTERMVDSTADPNMIVVPYYDNIPRPFYNM